MFLDAVTEITLHFSVLLGKEGELWVLVGKGSLHLRLLRSLSRREMLGVAGFCSVMVQMCSYLGSYGPGSGRAVGSTTPRLLHVQQLFVNSLITLNTILNGTKVFIHLC